MIVFRLSKSVFAADLTGTGSEKAGGRWNSKGVAMVYTSGTRALCTAEVAVHIPLGIVPDDYKLVTIEIPDDSITVIEEKDLPADWRSFPHSDSTQKAGDRFIRESIHLAMKVPSVVVQGEFNYLINPKHPDMKKTKILKTESFVFDERLFRR